MKCTILLLATFFALQTTARTEKPKETKSIPKEIINQNNDDRLSWWRDARFGMFIHWGPYAVPGGERNGKICDGGAEWIMDKLDYTIEDYEKKVVKKFNPVDFDADKWVSIAKDAGKKYLVFT